MSRSQGATRAQLIEALPVNKAAYIAALLYRILKEKGIKSRAERVETQREVADKID